MTLNQEDLKDIVETQLEMWPLAKTNHDRLAECRRRRFRLGNLEGAIQWNPARIQSTGADISAASLSERPCFLCRKNRPDEQIHVEIEPGWELLVNPYPVFPLHFTIASIDHRPQEDVPLEIISIAEKLPGMVVFFNGAKAGASAPDHLHLQAVLACELPLVNLFESAHKPSLRGIRSAGDLGLEIPFKVDSLILTPDKEGMRNALRMLRPNGGLLNMYAFMRPYGYMQMLRVERAAHRPSRYGNVEPEQYLVSPGSLEMAGIVIVPREEDFEKLTDRDLRQIYAECGVI